MRFARVIINLDAPLEGSFHYHLPPDMEGLVHPGHLVEVEFGHRMVQGIVMGLDERAPVPETKPIMALILPDPVLGLLDRTDLVFREAMPVDQILR